jgi:anti-sigma factor RsiW
MENYRPEEDPRDFPPAGDHLDASGDESGDRNFEEDEGAFRRFELISAYIDGEVTPQERHEVQRWLDTDRDAKKLYLQLLGIGAKLPNIPAPVSLPADILAERVFQKVGHLSRGRRRLFYGGAILAATALAIFSAGLFGRDTPTSRMARHPSDITRENEPLMIALNHPIVEIPAPEESHRER